MQEAELFFNAGDDGKQANWLIFPYSLSSQEMQEILEITASFASSIFRNEGYYKFMKIEETLKKNNAYPDPTKFKEFSARQYAQLKNGAIIYRICYDGRRESKSGRVNSSIAIDIIEEIGNQLPKDIEKLLVARNFDIFKKLYREYASSGQLNSLYNHFYIACDGREISVTKNVEVSPIYKLGALSRIFN